MDLETAVEAFKPFSRRDTAKLRPFRLMSVTGDLTQCQQMSCSRFKGQRTVHNAPCPMKAKKKLSLSLTVIFMHSNFNSKWNASVFAHGAGRAGREGSAVQGEQLLLKQSGLIRFS